MNKYLVITLCVVILGSLYAMTNFSASKTSANVAEIKWYTLEEAVEANKIEKRKFAMDIYTSWCHWCKVMDKETFTDPEVIKYLNENFYAVKFDGESKEKINFQGKEFKFVQAGRRGINTLAYYLLDGRAAYPTIVYLDENLQKIKAAPGFKKPQQLLEELRAIEAINTDIAE